MDINLLQEAATKVFAELGLQSETTYRNALSIELQVRKQGPVTMEVVAPILYHGCTVGHNRYDVSCGDMIIELKAVKTAPQIDSYVQQCMRYSKSDPGKHVALVVFGPTCAKAILVCNATPNVQKNDVR